MKTCRSQAAASLALAALVLLLPAPGAAQTSGGAHPESDARLRIGPLFLTPTLAIKDVGTDSNVFNEASEPQEDWTATIAPAVRGGMRAGRALLTVSTAVDLVFYRRFKEQESVNQTHHGQVELSLNRIRPYAAVDLTRTRSRPGFEIDARARRTEPTYRGGAEITVSGRTSLTVGYRRTIVEFDEREQFLGASLRERLNREATAVDGSLRFAVTPLTAFVVLAEKERARFDFNRLRDSDSLRVTAGFDFDPDALFRGRAYVGYRSFEPRGGGVPGYTGIVASLGLSTTVAGATRVDVDFDRDVAYSFEDVTPYYIGTGGSATITQRIIGPFDVQGRIGRQHLSYRAIETTASPDRADVVDLLGGGIGYRVGDTGRVALNVEYAERRSDLAPRTYDRLRLFGSLTYGLR
jgi:hypothetical protein